MSSSGDPDTLPEIVIIRRKSGEDAPGVKGGAWKIAYADFVTAMMAFFLVMWLINASNEATRAQVASYFNPIKLTDSSTGNRGLRDRKERRTTDSDSSEDNLPMAGDLTSDDVAREALLMTDPDAVLARIAAEAEAQRSRDGGNVPSDSTASSRSSDMVPGVGDPFDPRSWEKIESPQPVPAAPPEGTPPVDGAATRDVEPEPSPTRPAEGKPRPAGPEPADHPRPPPAGQPPQDAAPAPDQPRIPGPQEQLAADIARDIAAAMGSPLRQLPAAVEVKAVSDGVLISLTDTANFGMFRTGSAEPEPQLLALVEAVAAALRDRPGFIVVRGHTDSRPFRNRRHDNWQLSTARAHFAQYMLVRGGLDESRIRRIEGMADRDPRIPDDPAAAANRRIEILLGLDTP